jgi:uncharacterized protein
MNLPTASISRRWLIQAAVGSSGFDPLLAVGADGKPLGVVGQPRRESGIWKSLRDRAARMEIFDTHEHLWHERDRLKKKLDCFLLFSHYNDGDLVTAGMPREGIADLQNPAIPLETRWKALAPYWPYTRATGYGRCILIAARDLYGVEDINDRTYHVLSDRIAAANKPGLYENVLKQKGRIELSVLDDLESRNGNPLQPEPKFYKLVTRFDYIILAGARKDLDLIERVTGVAIHDLAGLERALEKAVERAMAEGLSGIKCALAYQRTLRFERVSREDATRAFERIFAPSASADEAVHKTLQDYLMHRMIQQAAERRLPVQIHTGMLAGNRAAIANTDPTHLSDLLNRYQQVRFDLFHGGYPYCSQLASMAKSLPNVYPDLCWLHIIAPVEAKRLLHELIETVPANKILGYGGDFRHVEGAYAHAQMARAITAEVLAEKVEGGYLKEEEAGFLLERILHHNGKDLFSAV